MNQATLTALIGLADGHQKADEYVSGHYEWAEGGACAIGCTIRDAKKIGLVSKNVKYGDHKALAAANGVPEMAWILCDYIFEGLQESERAAWTPRFLRAIKPDADYANLAPRIMARFADKLSEDATDPIVKSISKRCADMWRLRARGKDPTPEEWTALEKEADAARQQAYAARQQAYAAKQQYWRWCADVVCEELQRT